jgi:hypothetical protein
MFTNGTSHLAPGGIFEIQDAELHPQSDDGTLLKDNYLTMSMKFLGEAMEHRGCPFIGAEDIKTHMEEVGFEGIEEERFSWPTNPWPRDDEYKWLGRLTLDYFRSRIEGLLLRPLINTLGWTRDEVQVLAAGARKVHSDKNVHAYWKA